MATGNCPGDNTEKTAAAKAKVRTDIKTAYIRIGLQYQCAKSEFTSIFSIQGQYDCYQRGHTLTC